jgi:hypothetical protein
MHIEKNICENLIGTLLKIAGKTNDTMLGLIWKRWALDQVYTWWQLIMVSHAKGQKLRMYFQKRNRSCFVIL